MSWHPNAFANEKYMAANIPTTMGWTQFLNHSGSIPYLQIFLGILIGALSALAYAKFCRPPFIFGTERTQPPLLEALDDADEAQKRAKKVPARAKSQRPPQIPEYPVETFTGAEDKEDLSHSEYHNYEPFEPSDAVSQNGDQMPEPPFNNITGYTIISGVASLPREMRKGGDSHIAELPDEDL